jgi:pantetheine-phosphate adenylyltransferase
MMAPMNYRLDGYENRNMTTNPTWSYLSSSLVKDVARHGGDVTGLVPDFVVARLRERAQQPPV